MHKKSKVGFNLAFFVMISKVINLLAFNPLFL